MFFFQLYSITFKLDGMLNIEWSLVFWALYIIIFLSLFFFFLTLLLAYTAGIFIKGVLWLLIIFTGLSIVLIAYGINLVLFLNE